MDSAKAKAQKELNSATTDEAKKAAQAKLSKLDSDFAAFKAQGSAKIAEGAEKTFANKLAKGMSAGSFLQSAGSQLGSLNNTQTVGTTARKRVQVRTIQRRQFR